MVVVVCCDYCSTGCLDFESIAVVVAGCRCDLPVEDLSSSRSSLHVLMIKYRSLVDLLKLRVVIPWRL